MKTFSEFRNKLTAKQSSNYALLCAIVLTLIAGTLIAIFSWSSLGPLQIFLVLIFLTIFCCCLYILFYGSVFKGERKESEERQAEARQRVISSLGLNTTTRTKVRYKFEEALKDSKDKDWIITLLKIPEYKFYLKLTEYENIEFVVTDKENYILHVDTLKNFIYVDTYFDKIDE